MGTGRDAQTQGGPHSCSHQRRPLKHWIQPAHLSIASHAGLPTCSRARAVRAGNAAPVLHRSARSGGCTSGAGRHLPSASPATHHDTSLLQIAAVADCHHTTHISSTGTLLGQLPAAALLLVPPPRAALTTSCCQAGRPVSAACRQTRVGSLHTRPKKHCAVAAPSHIHTTAAGVAVQGMPLLVRPGAGVLPLMATAKYGCAAGASNDWPLVRCTSSCRHTSCTSAPGAQVLCARWAPSMCGAVAAATA